MGNSTEKCILIYDPITSLENSLKISDKIGNSLLKNYHLNLMTQKNMDSFQLHLDTYIRGNKTFFAWFYVNKIGREKLFRIMSSLRKEGYICIRSFDREDIEDIYAVKGKKLSRICFGISVDIYWLFFLVILQKERDIKSTIFDRNVFSIIEGYLN